MSHESEGQVKLGGVSPGPDITDHAASVPGTPDRGPSVSLAEAIEILEAMDQAFPLVGWPFTIDFDHAALRTVIGAARTQLTEPEPPYPYLAAPSGAAHEGSEE